MKHLIEYMHQRKYLPAFPDVREKGFMGKYILVFSCQNGQADFLNPTYVYIEKGTSIQKYANNATKLKIE